MCSRCTYIQVLTKFNSFLQQKFQVYIKPQKARIDRKQHNTIQKNLAELPRVGRQKLIYSILLQFLDRFHSNNPDKKYNRLLAIQAAPGGGKSFFLDELALLKDEDLQFLISGNSTRKNYE
jgi:hypothetical protein